MKQNPLFLPHGAPDLVLKPGPATEFLSGIGDRIRSAASVVMISPHWQTDTLKVSAPGVLDTIHDFRGFPDQLYKIKYAAEAKRCLVDHVLRTTCRAGLAIQEDSGWGLDHGAWIPLSLSNPEGGIPVVQVSLPKHYDLMDSYELGKALAPLAENDILIIGTGATIHNFKELGSDETPTPQWALDFDEHVKEAMERADANSVINLSSHPDYTRALPTDEHLLPLAVVCGAAGANARGRRIHHSYTYSTLSMSAYEFGSFEAQRSKAA
ncbi:class III extradiol ring-cleavage dioxygenase [Pseudovibrio exalbescens]|uniref:DODA-type extradiol aromatic ring-opening family dioxygenase n=1 Tax=Pseudovibrio exalbescens TaxID=197461 RepID=UPI002366CDB7|nr:class III extradiol ring-cleavage dioxygenase [Pseudovibrio exalbescens]MDD7909547.1 class III extradiol ring-cleavage dioxygenase [Pseudovibrio exalbescens]